MPDPLEALRRLRTVHIVEVKEQDIVRDYQARVLVQAAQEPA